MSCLPVNLLAHRWACTTVTGANGLAKRYLYSLPDPFAVLTIDDGQSRTTKTAKKTLTPTWNEKFDV